MAIVLSLILIVIYVWIRFGSIRYGVGAILSLVHDAVVALGLVVRGGTPHFDYVAAEVSKGIATVSMQTMCLLARGFQLTGSCSTRS